MTQYKPSLLIGELKGSSGSTTFQKGNNASVIKRNSYKKGKSSVAKSAATSILSQVTTSWKDVTDDEKLLWATAALAWPFKDKFGTTYYGSAYQCFTAYNSILLTLGIAAAKSPGKVSAPLNVNPITVSTCDDSDIILDAVISPSSIQYWLIYASPQMSNGRNNNNAKFRLVRFLDMNGKSSVNIFANYQEIFGTPVSGRKIVFKVVQVLPDYPYQYFPFTVSSIIA